MKFWRLLTLKVIFILALPVFSQPMVIDEMEILRSPIHFGCVKAHTETGNWQSISLHRLPQDQRFCLRKAIEINPVELTDVTAVMISILGSSRLYWDGELIAENGVVGSHQQSEVPGEIYYVAPIPAELISPGKHQLMIDVSNFHISEQMSSVFYYLAVGDYASAVAYPLKQSAPAVLFIGGLLVIGLLFQIFFWLYQRRILYQVFSLLCFSSMLLLLAEKWRSLFGYSYDWHTVRMHWITLFTYITCFILPAFYLVYYQTRKLAVWLPAIAVFLVPPLFVPGYDGKSAMLFLFSLLIALALNLRMLTQKAPGAGLNSFIIVAVLALRIFFPYTFLEDRFAVTSFAIVLVVLASLIQEMKANRIQALATARYEVELLKRNLQPHFLMNSLMLVIEWIEQKPYAAAGFVQALAEELRMLVKFSGERTIPLAEEIALCRRHLEIMGYRYNTRYELITNGQLEGIAVPPAVLHTQIENAFSHNYLQDGSTFEFTITRRKDKVALVFCSPFNENSKREGLGLGERYIRTRLAEVFGRDSRYESKMENNCWLSTIEFRTG